MKQYSKWKDEEVAKLFAFIESGKKRGISLTGLFDEYAKMTNRMPNSVRNYYYNELNCLQNDISRQQKLNINLINHKKIDPKEFSQQETKELVIGVLKLTSKGMSVRKACQTLAGDDIAVMVRLQNKYRSTVAKNKELVNSCIKELNIGSVRLKPAPNNIIKMPDRRNVLTESDINSLFLGLVKLVKKQATEEAGRLFEKEKIKANAALRRTLTILSEKENELKLLRKQFKLINQEKEKLCEELKLLRGQTASLKAQQSKLNQLKQFAKRYQNKKIEEL